MLKRISGRILPTHPKGNKNIDSKEEADFSKKRFQLHGASGARAVFFHTALYNIVMVFRHGGREITD